MKRIDLKMNEQHKYEVIKSLVDHDGNKIAAAVKLGCTPRHINRLIKKYKEKGKEAFVHGNRGRKPVHSFTEEQKLEIITIYNNKYFDATFAYACELLAENDGIYISPSAFTKIMYENFITSPRTTKAVRKRLAKELSTQQKTVNSKQKQDELQAAIVLNDKLLSPSTALYLLFRYRTDGRIASPNHDSVDRKSTRLNSSHIL